MTSNSGDSSASHTALLLLHVFVSAETCLLNRSIATAVRATFPTVVCGHYIATAVSLPPQFLIRANTPQSVSFLWDISRYCQYLDYTASNGRNIDELERIWKEAALA
jgi:hypothetical protein